jgi:D-aminopeptidase
MPITVTIEFFTSDFADRASLMPFTKRDGTRVSFTAQEMDTIYRGFRAMVTLASG